MKVSSWIISLVAFFSWANSELHAQTAPRPNIIFVLTDDLGYGDLGIFYQNSRKFTENRNLPAFLTPNLDEMASDGIQLTRHYCGAPVCAPSRASLLLGVHQGHANVRDNQFDKALEDNHTLGSVMSSAGYSTAVIGKWGLQGDGSPENQPGHPLKRGFDYFFGATAHLTGHFHYAELMEGRTDNRGQSCELFDGYTSINDIADHCYSTDLYTARAKKWIEEQNAADPDKPFFLYLALTAPHAQLNVPTQAYPDGGGLAGGMQWLGIDHQLINTASGNNDSWIHPDYANATYDNDDNPGTPEVAWPDYAKRHATMIRRIDNALADIRTLLEDIGIADNTLIVFTADNGPHNEAGAGGSYTQNPRFFRSYAKMDGIKRDTWEAGIRVPALACWPAGIPAGSASNAASQFHDWMPTFAQLAGIPAPARSDGVSLVPTLTASGTQDPGTVYVEYYNNSSTPSYADFEAEHRSASRRQMQVVLLNGYKGIRCNIGSADDDFIIYDTDADPKETTPLAAGTGDIPSQQEFKDAVLRLRRADSNAARPYDSQPVPAETPASVRPGLAWRCFEGDYPWVPSFDNLIAVDTGEGTQIDTAVRSREHDIAIEFSGYINVPADGNYRFYLEADTGAFLRLHGMQLIDADMGYTPGTAISSGSLPLKAGYHPFTLSYRHADAASHRLVLKWESEAIDKQIVPESAYYIDGAVKPGPPTATDDYSATTGSTNGPGAAVLVDVLSNDRDDGIPAPLSIAAVTHPSGGSAVIESGQIRYTPFENFFGEDVFQYQASDGSDSDTADVRVEVKVDSENIWLPLDEGEGLSVYDAGGGLRGTLVDFDIPPGWTNGPFHGALAFDGIDDKIVLSGEKGVVGRAARTVMFWLNAASPQATAGRPTIISWGANNGATAGIRFDINLNDTGGFRLRSEFNSSGVNYSTAEYSDLRGAGWVHCAIVMPENGTVSSLICYINGIEAEKQIEPSGSGGTAIDTSEVNDITIGNWATDNTRPFTGILDDLRIYNRALAPGEIGAVYSESNPQATSWYYRHHGRTPSGVSDWKADPEGNGMSALQEYGFGCRPFMSVSDGCLLDIGAGSEGLVLSYRRRMAAEGDASYALQYSNDLLLWQELLGGDASSTPDADLSGFERVARKLPPESQPSSFMRLQLSL